MNKKDKETCLTAYFKICNMKNNHNLHHIETINNYIILYNMICEQKGFIDKITNIKLITI